MTATILYSFGFSASDGHYPVAGVIQGSDGNFYGTTAYGGKFDAGSVFQISRSGKESVLYSFGAYPSDGEEPYAAVTQGTDGNLYGTTVYGGAHGGAVLFKLNHVEPSTTP